MKKTGYLFFAILVVFVTTGIAVLVWMRHGSVQLAQPVPTATSTNQGNASSKIDLIRLDVPQPGQKVTSPLLIKGTARGTWFFEASFPIVLIDARGVVLAQGHAQAKSDWMTTAFVPFEATLNIIVPTSTQITRTGTLILRKDNPSGLVEKDDALTVPVLF